MRFMKPKRESSLRLNAGTDGHWKSPPLVHRPRGQIERGREFSSTALVSGAGAIVAGYVGNSEDLMSDFFGYPGVAGGKSLDAGGMP